MSLNRGTISRILFVLVLISATLTASAQSGNAGTVRGTLTDPSGAVVPNAAVHLINDVSGFDQTATTNAQGQFVFSNVPFNPYRISAVVNGFAPLNQGVEIRSSVGTNIKLTLKVTGGSSTVTVEASGDLVEDDPTFHTDVDRDLFIKVPLESQSSSLSSLVTLSTPGVAADSNGLFHGLGDHASNSFSIDGQSITDQQSKVFSNQLPANAVQSIEVISGAPPAEFGGKTSLVIVATTRSGQGITRPTGEISGSYGTFGSATVGADLAYGGKNWGNFVEADGLNTGRFLDPPEFAVFHDKGNEENFFDRVDYAFTQADSVHIDFNYSRSWFQTPNAFDNLNIQNVVSGGTSANPVFGNVGNTDQRSKIGTFNISPTYTRVISTNSVLNFGAYVRRDDYNYYPSGNPLADQGPPNLQTSSISQNRTLTNAAVHSDFDYSKGIHTFKAGVVYGQTFLRETRQPRRGRMPRITRPALTSTATRCRDTPIPSQCDGVVSFPNPSYLSVLAPYDLTRGGSYYTYFGHTDVKELALYVEDQIKAGNWLFNLGMRGDIYNGLATAQPGGASLGVGYHIKPSSTVLSVSYARTLETPFNENLVLSSQRMLQRRAGAAAPLPAREVQGTLQPGFRNEFHASLQQAFGKHAVVSGEYIWKYTHNAFDFSVLGNTPITFPIDWHNSKIPGYALRAEVPVVRGFSAYFVTSSVAARFFPPQVAGAGATVGQTGLPFRIDHDEKFNQTTHLQYTLSHGKHAERPVGRIQLALRLRPGGGQRALLRHDRPQQSLLAPLPRCSTGSRRSAMVDAFGVPLTADEEFQAGFMCNGQRATPTNPLPARVPGFGVHLEPDQHSGPEHRRQR